MKLIIALLIASAAFAQNSITVRVVKNGVEQVAKVTGQAAADHIDIIEQWMATQKVCNPKPAVPAVMDEKGAVISPEIPADPGCVAKYANVAEVGKEFIVGQAEQLSTNFPSSALTTDIAAAKAKADIVAAKRKALFDAARAEK